MYKILLFLLGLPFCLQAQLKWKKVDSLFQPLPESVHVYFTNDSLDGKPNIAYYVEADLKDQSLDFRAATAVKGKRYKPDSFYLVLPKPLLVVNCTFFEFKNNSNLNLVMDKGKVLANNIDYVKRVLKGTPQYYYSFRSAIGISVNRDADVAWIYTHKKNRYPTAIQFPFQEIPKGDSPLAKLSVQDLQSLKIKAGKWNLPNEIIPKWKMQTAVGGGPTLISNDSICVTNDLEMLFVGKSGLTDKHPRTAMGYTKDNKLIILVIQGRFPQIAEGANLIQEARILQQLGCTEALNLDGGGSSCMLINGKPTIQVSDKTGQRAVPAVFWIGMNKK